jgi:protocatechuate 3,4-dioxygenase beta subunit
LLVGANGDDDHGSASGAAYVFVHSNGNWTQQAKLTPNDGDIDDEFGRHVALDGDTALVSSHWDDDNGDASGAAYVFVRSGSSWNQQAKLTANDGAAGDEFSWGIALEGDVALVGAPLHDASGTNSGAVYVFERSGSSWNQEAKITASDGDEEDRFGWFLAMDNGTALMSALTDDENGTTSGSTYVFEGSGSSWTEQTKLIPNDADGNNQLGFGAAVDIDQDTAIISAIGDDDNGDHSGSVYVFVRDGSSWTQQAKLTPNDGAEGDHLGGWGIDIEQDVFLVGAAYRDSSVADSGAMYVFTRSGENWSQQHKVVASDADTDDLFGWSVALSGNRAATGGHANNDNGTRSGSAYTFELTFLSSITGQVTDSAGDPVADVTISTGNETTMTASDGSYSFSGLDEGSYTLEATKTGCTFTPTSLSVTIPPDASGQDFTATCAPDTSTISGEVMDENGDPVAGVTIADDAANSTTTSSDGTYALGDLPAGTYTFTPTLDGYTFEPASRTVSVPPDATAQDFIATPRTYTITGSVMDTEGNPITNVEIATTGSLTTTTASDGSYSFSGLNAGSYTLEATKTGCTFTPTSLSVTIPPDASGQDFAATCAPDTSTISGEVMDENGDPVAGVTIADDAANSTTTSSDGTYALGDLPTGTYILTPTLSDCTFTPTSLSVTVPPDASGQDFTATCEADTFTISGQVMDENGDPVAGVTITESSGDTVSTANDGTYFITNLMTGTYTLTPTLEGYTFSPVSRVVRVPPDAAEQNFTATRGGTSSITGRVTDAKGTPISDVTISDGSGHTTTTADDGTYTLNDIPAGRYTLTASKEGYTFAPSSIAITVPPDANNQDFTATMLTFSIVGRVTDASGNPISGVTISDGTGQSIVTDRGGYYTFYRQPVGSYTLTAAKNECTFSPATQTVSVPPSHYGQNFTATCATPTYTLSGRVLDNRGNPVAGTIISDNHGHTTRSGSNGRYAFYRLEAGNYTLTPFKQDYTFSPQTHQVNLSANTRGQDFTATYQSERLIDVTISLYNNPGQTQKRLYERIIEFFADGVFESSNGAHKLGRVTFYPNSGRHGRTHIKWIANCWPNAYVACYGQEQEGRSVEMCDTFNDHNFLNPANSTDQENAGYVLAHEWGHYFYSLYDEYRKETAACNPGKPNRPCASDTPVQNSIMNSQWNARGGNFAWLNFSTPLNNTRNTAQHRMYGASGWETLARPLSEDPPGVRRLYYPELAEVAPAADQAPRIDLTDGHSARSNLSINWNTQTAQLAQGEPSTMRQIVIDVSDTMYAAHKLEHARTVATWLVNQADIGKDAIGIITYDGTPTVVQPVTLIDSEATRKTLIAKIQAITAGGEATATGDALATALTTLTDVYGDNLAVQTNARVLLITGGPAERDPSPFAVISNYDTAAVPIAAIGYGIDADTAIMLETLARETNGMVAFVDPRNTDRQNTGLVDLLNALETATQTTSLYGDTTITSANSTIQGTHAQFPFQVDSTLDTLDVNMVINTTAPITPTLYAPDGQAVGVTNCMTTTTHTLCQVQVNATSVVTGTWEIALHTSESPLEISYRVHGQGTPTFLVSVDILPSKVIEYPAAATIVATLRKEALIARASVSATVQTPSGAEQSLTMRDDGIAPDTIANDGSYAATLEYTRNGMYAIQVGFNNSEGTAEETYAGVEFVPEEDGTVIIPEPTPVAENFTRVAETQIYVTAIQEDDHGDTPQTATDLPPDNNEMAGRIDFAGDLDIFQITTSDQGTLAVRITGLLAGMEPEIRLLAADGTTVLGTMTAPPTNEAGYLYLTQEAEPDDMFYLEVSHRNPSATSGYYNVSAGSLLATEETERNTTEGQIYLPMIGR